MSMIGVVVHEGRGEAMGMELTGRDLERGYAVERDLERLISRRGKPGNGGEPHRRPHSEPWVAAARRRDQREREQNRWEWVRYFDRMASSHRRLSEDYRARADELAGEGGVS